MAYLSFTEMSQGLSRFSSLDVGRCKRECAGSRTRRIMSKTSQNDNPQSRDGVEQFFFYSSNWASTVSIDLRLSVIVKYNDYAYIVEVPLKYNTTFVVRRTKRCSWPRFRASCRPLAFNNGRSRTPLAVVCDMRQADIHSDQYVRCVR